MKNGFGFHTEIKFCIQVLNCRWKKTTFGGQLLKGQRSTAYMI